mgnify:CR=1 FL=1
MPKRTDLKKILVIGSGKVTGVVDGRKATKEQIGYLMTANSGVCDEGGQLRQRIAAEPAVMDDFWDHEAFSVLFAAANR